MLADDYMELAEPTPGSASSRRATVSRFMVNDDMGESGLQFHVCHVLVQLFNYYFECLQRPMLVSGNQYFYPSQDDPGVGLAPDVYVVADETTPVDEVKSWKLWEHEGKGPCLAIEVVSDDPEEARKDYDPALLEKYEALGVREVFRYDPHCGTPARRLQGRRRRLLSHFVRGEDGRLREQEPQHRDRVKSVQFDLWLVHVAPRTLRLGTGPSGQALWPTKAEAEARRAEEEARRAEEEARRAEEEARRAEEEARRAEGETRKAESALAALEKAREREAALLAELEALRAQQR